MFASSVRATSVYNCAELGAMPFDITPGPGGEEGFQRYLRKKRGTPSSVVHCPLLTLSSGPLATLLAAGSSCRLIARGAYVTTGRVGVSRILDRGRNGLDNGPIPNPQTPRGLRLAP